MKTHHMLKKKPDPEMQQFQADLLQSVHDMKSGRTGRVHCLEMLGDASPTTQQGRTTKAKGKLNTYDHNLSSTE